MADESSKEDPEDLEFVAETWREFYLSHIYNGNSWCLGSENLSPHFEMYHRRRNPVPRSTLTDDNGDRLMMDKLRRIYDQNQVNLKTVEHQIMNEIRAMEQRKLFEIQENSRRKRCEIAEKNARELIQEEEEEKLKAQKKKAKKERQKQKKTETKSIISKKVSSDIKKNTDSVSHAVKKLSLNNEVEELDEIETKSPSVNKAITKLEKQPIINNEPKQQDVEPIIKKTLYLINEKKYKEAIQHLSEAVVLAPTRVDLLLKRCWVYFEMAKYKKSLQDAEKSLKILPFNPEGYYRLGEANSALHNYSEADAAFSKLVHNSTYQSEVKEKLFSLRIKQLEEMGYNSNEAFTALLKSENKTLDEAIDFLTSLQNGTAPTDDLYYSDEDDSDFKSSDEEEEDEELNNIKKNSVEVKYSLEPTIAISKKSSLLTDPSNPFECCSLFVVGMKKDITAKEVQDVFVKFGDISSMKLSTDPKVYAFINYVEWQSAGQAMEALQGSRWLLSTTKALTVKYPVKVVNKMIPHVKNLDIILSQLKAEKEESQTRFRYRPKPTNIPFKPHLVNPAYSMSSPGDKSRPRSATTRIIAQKNVKDLIDHKAPSQFPVVQHVSTGRPRPTPKTEECYYWRTTGCTFGNKCFNLHIPKHKGIALRDKSANTDENLKKANTHENLKEDPLWA